MAIMTEKMRAELRKQLPRELGKTLRDELTALYRVVDELEWTKERLDAMMASNDKMAARQRELKKAEKKVEEREEGVLLREMALNKAQEELQRREQSVAIREAVASERERLSANGIAKAEAE